MLYKWLCENRADLVDAWSDFIAPVVQFKKGVICFVLGHVVEQDQCGCCGEIESYCARCEDEHEQGFSKDRYVTPIPWKAQELWFGMLDRLGLLRESIGHFDDA